MRVAWLKDLRLPDLPQVGGKNASLGEMTGALSSAGIRVPGGFATTAAAFEAFLSAGGLDRRIADRIKTLNPDDVSALAACNESMPDGILLDWNMPNMSGIEFLRALRREPSGGKPIVVYCTTENDVAHITEAIGAGANEYLLKPFDRDIVEAKFAEAGLI